MNGVALSLVPSPPQTLPPSPLLSVPALPIPILFSYVTKPSPLPSRSPLTSERHPPVNSEQIKADLS